MHQHMDNGHRVGNSVLMGSHHRRVDNNVGDFTDLSRLHHDDTGVNPASVTGVVVRAQGADQHEEQKNVERHHNATVLRQVVQIDGGHQGVHERAQTDGNHLNDQILDIASEFLSRGGAGDADNTKARHTQAQNQEDHIALLDKVF